MGSNIVQINLERCALDWIFMESSNPGSNGRFGVYLVVVRYDHIQALNTPTQTPTYHPQFTFFENSVSATCEFMPWGVHEHPQNKNNECCFVFCTGQAALSGMKKCGLAAVQPSHVISHCGRTDQQYYVLLLLHVFGNHKRQSGSQSAAARRARHIIIILHARVAPALTSRSTRERQ